jgi:hypothetical protein
MNELYDRIDEDTTIFHLLERAFMFHCVISGGQTGADQGGLLAAQKRGVLTGGTCPEGWLTSTGPNPLLAAFGLVPKGSIKSRTIQNIKDSDATVVLTLNAASPGSVLTVKTCKQLGKPVLEIDMNELLQATLGATQGFEYNAGSKALYDFILKHEVSVLNVAGNREKRPDLMTTYLAEHIVGGAIDLLILDKIPQKARTLN